METEVSFKRGCDLAEQADVVPSEVIACESCAAQAESASAAKLGWQMRPPVCPDCLHWTATESQSATKRESPFRIEKRGRFWAVFEGAILVCITVYRKGAESVIGRLEKGATRHGSN